MWVVEFQQPSLCTSVEHHGIDQVPSVCTILRMKPMTLGNKRPWDFWTKRNSFEISVSALSFLHTTSFLHPCCCCGTQSNVPKAHEKSRWNRHNGYEKLVMKLWQLVMKSSSGGKSRWNCGNCGWKAQGGLRWNSGNWIWKTCGEWRWNCGSWVFFICILPKNLGLLRLCKADALLQLPCGAEFELNVDALYMSLTNFPKS